MGKIKFAHDSDTPCLSEGRLALAIITFPFVVYLIPGSKGSSDTSRLCIRRIIFLE